MRSSIRSNPASIVTDRRNPSTGLVALATSCARLHVPLIRHMLQKRTNSSARFRPRSSRSRLACADTLANRRRCHAARLLQRVFVCQPALLFVADAAVEIVAMAASRQNGTRRVRKQVVHKLRDGTMQSLHHGAEVFANAQVAERVIVIVEQACDPGREAELTGVVVEAVPEYRLRLLRWRRRGSGRGSGR